LETGIGGRRRERGREGGKNKERHADNIKFELKCKVIQKTTTSNKHLRE